MRERRSHIAQTGMLASGPGPVRQHFLRSARLLKRSGLLRIAPRSWPAGLSSSMGWLAEMAAGHFRQSTRARAGVSVACAALLAGAAGAARADDLLGYYFGGTYGKGTVDASTGLVSGFGVHSSAYTVIAGWRFMPELSAELQYLDFGHSAGMSIYKNSDVPLTNSASRKGEGAFGILYLPTPIVDFYMKAGLAKLHTTATTMVGTCPKGGVCPPLSSPLPVDSTGVGVAGGGGVMYRFRSLEIRAEYERFAALGGNPYVVTGGFTWTF